MQISEETAKDKELQAVMEHFHNGWLRGVQSTITSDQS